MPNRPRIAGVLLLALLTTAARGAAERWYVMLMEDRRAGWMVERERDEDGRVVSESDARLTLRRGDTPITLEIQTRFVESPAGEPIEMSNRTTFGGGPSEQRFEFTPDAVLYTASGAGVTKTERLPLPEGRWLPPAAASQYLAARLAAGADRITTRTLDPLNGPTPITTERSEFERTTIEVMGRSVEAIRCTSVSSLYPDAAGVEFLDERGRLLRSELQLGEWNITILAADKQLALSPVDPPELMQSVFVRPDRAVESPYRARRGVFIVAATSGELPDLPATGSQRVERIDERTIRVLRDLDAEPTEPGPEDTAPLLAASAMLDRDDPRVRELARDGLAAAPAEPAARAETLRRLVHRHIRTKDLSVGFASASEVARTREGDCTEHAVLLAALLRADGIPARVVSGLIYADQPRDEDDAFGYHMWTQALLPTGAGPRWIDLDATLPDALPMTATHIALGVTALPTTERINALVDLAPLMGRLAIAVETLE